MWDERPHGGPTIQDIFYVKLCIFQFVFEALAKMVINQISDQRETTVMVTHSNQGSEVLSESGWPICDVTNDKERSDEYTRKYKEFDVLQFAISLYLRQQRHG